MHTITTVPRQTYKRMTIILHEDEMNALRAMARRDRRLPKQQVQWLIAKAAIEAGLLHEAESKEDL